MKSKVIALSAIASAIIAVLLTLGAYIEFVDIFALIIASVFVILPIYYRSYLGAVLCFLAGGVLAFLCSGLNIMSIVFPAYFGFIGLYPIVKCKFMDKNFNKVLGAILGLIWCLLAVYGVYYYFIFVAKGVLDGLPEFIMKYITYFVGLVGIVFYFVFDRFILVMRILFNKYLSKIIK